MRVRRWIARRYGVRIMKWLYCDPAVAPSREYVTRIRVGQ